MRAEGDVGNVVPLERGASGSRDFRTFFEDEHARLFKTLYFVTGDRQEAADQMQEAFLKLWERWDAVERIEDLRAYLFRVALNGSRMRVRAARRAANRRLPVGSVRDDYEDIELREDVRRLLAAISPRQRAALVLLDLYGYGSEEAGAIMGIRPSTVRALATQGRTVLREGGPHA
jgi:RNA polymerase sigma-70 factor (ECF subfamily)